MKKLTAGIFATLLAVVSADGAYAAIASSGYVDDKVGEVSQTVTTLSGTVSGHTTSIGEIEGKMGTYGDIVTHNVAEFATAAEGDLATSAVQPADITNVERTTNKTQTVNAQSTEAQYPSAKAVWNAVSSVDANASVEALEGRVDTLEATSATHATKTELAGKQDKLSQTGSASQPVYVNAEGKVTAGNTIPTVTTSITTGQTGAAQAGAVATALAAKANSADLGALAKLNAVGSAQITDGAVATTDIADKAVTEAKLSDTVNASLDKADSALQQADLAEYQTKDEADAAYAVKALEGQVGSVSAENMGTTATTVVTAIKEVAGEAAAAQRTATGAQNAVDAVESTIGGYGDIVSHNASEFATTTALTSGLAGKLDSDATAARATADAAGNVITTTYATKTEIADMATDENLKLKQDKTDNSLATTNKTVVGAINEVKTTADGASTAAGAAQTAADDAQADATKALADAATAQSAAEAAQTAANSKLPTSTYNTQVGSVSATNMGTTATTVVAAIKEVAGEAAAAQSTASSANTAAGEAQEAAEAAQATADQAQQTANAAIPAPTAACADSANKCVLVSSGAGNYSWEVIARNGEGE